MGAGQQVEAVEAVVGAIVRVADGGETRNVRGVAPSVRAWRE